MSFFVLKAAVALLYLGYASVEDAKTKQVSVWKEWLALPFGLALNLLTPDMPIPLVLAVCFFLLVALKIGSGLGLWGEAEAWLLAGSFWILPNFPVLIAALLIASIGVVLSRGTKFKNVPFVPYLTAGYLGAVIALSAGGLK